MRDAGLPAGAALAAVGVLAGAFGAHVLGERLDAHHLALWETAVRYLLLAAVGLMITGLARGRIGSSARPVARCLLAGAVLFSGAVGALALGAPRWLGAVAPAGGTLLVAGFAWLAGGAWRARSASGAGD